MYTIDTDTTDSTFLSESQIPAGFRNVDYPALNGIDGLTDSEDPTSWDFARFAEAS